MADWRLAYSLDQLRTEINARWPNRNKASDGTIGDPSHAATASDHNPNPAGVVCAFDITHDPVNGPDIELLGRQLAAHPHRDCKYVIFNRKIASRNYQWAIRAYKGDPHTSHVHVSVGTGPDGQSTPPYDDRNPWLTVAPTPGPVPPTPTGEDTDLPLHIIKGTTTGEWWVTDWISKRYIDTPDEAAQIIFSTVATGGKIEHNGQSGPVEYAQAVVDNIPREATDQ